MLAMKRWATSGFLVGIFGGIIGSRGGRVLDWLIASSWGIPGRQDFHRRFRAYIHRNPQENTDYR